MQKLMRRTFVFVAALSMASAAHAADSPEGTLVTDPATLARMGFSPDAVVYLAPGVSLSEGATPAPQNWGTAAPIQQAHAGNDFQGRISTYAYNSPTGQRDVSFTGGDIFVDAPLSVQSGAIWESSRFWVNDTLAQDLGLFLIRSCLPVAGPGVPVATIIGTGASTGAGGDQSVVVTAAASTVIDNNACIYWVRVRFDAAGLILRKARSQYRLQVSPAPAVATFPNDVPTTHPFFRFVEAMAASGLTGGCGPGAFCPDSPVTRGQFSVFLSVALGLHFPN